MFNAELKVDSNQTSNTVIDDHFLYILSSLFVESMTIDQCREPVAKIRHDQDPRKIVKSKSARRPLQPKSSVKALEIKEYYDRKADPQNADRKAHHDDTGTTIRTFILGLSDAFNDVLMGIWGNLSLINMRIDESNPLFHRIGQMELLIQNGSGFINGIFGYLGERRAVAKSIRLNQLLQEFNEYMPLDRCRLEQNSANGHGPDTPKNNCPTVIAGSLAHTLEQFIFRLQKHHDRIKEQRPNIKGFRDRLKTIDRQMSKAWEMIRLLKLYAGRYEIKTQKVSVRALIQRQLQQIKAKHNHLSISLDMAKRIPGTQADRKLLNFLFEQIVENALHAMPDKGDLRIDIRTLNTEAPQNRCVAYRWGDSIVITISDTGQGMDIDTLLHIFDPFFVGDQHNSNRLGMGLSAGWGIIKAHGGYIHVRSRLGRGSAFKIYLPIHQV